jgi:hypothetical protein
VPNDDPNELLVDAADGRITVRLRGTSMKVVYLKGSNPWLTIAETDEDRDASIDISQFRIRAWEAANEKARQLGWI